MKYQLDDLYEINEEPYFSMCQSGKRLQELPYSQAYELLELIIAKMAVVSSGFENFWDDATQESFIAAWISTLSNLTAVQIFTTACHARKGRTRFAPRAPSTPLEFLTAWRESRESMVPPMVIYSQVQIEAPKEDEAKSKAVAKDELSKMRDMLKAAKVSVRA